MSGLVPRTILKKSNEKHSIKPLPVEKPDIGAIDWTAPQSLSNGCSVRSNHESMVVGKVGRIPNLFGFVNLDVDVLRRRCRSFRALPEPVRRSLLCVSCVLCVDVPMFVLLVRSSL